jgi:hypothetical protein
MSEKKQCVSCDKKAGIMTCNGCDQIFCGKHSIEHRQQLANQLDFIMQEHDLVQQEFGQLTNDHPLFKKIDTWERESIAKIQTVAEASRVDLQKMIDESKERLVETCRDIAINLRSSREADDYSETELNQWTERLKQLQLEITSPLSVKVIENEWSIIDLIATQNDNTDKSIFASITQDRFSKVIGSVAIDELGLLAKHTSDDWNYEYVLGEQLYSEGRHTVHFKIEQSGTPYNIFFGCISSRANQNRISINSPFTAGWFGYNQVYQHGNRVSNSDGHGYNSNEIAANDTIHLIFDCEKKQIEFFHEDSNKRHVLRVNINKAPLPWQFLMVLTDKDDCVRILPISKLHSINKVHTDLLV